MAYAVRPLKAVNPETFYAAIPGSKSLTNRALIIAAGRMGRTDIRGALHCDDTDHLAACLNKFGGLRAEKTPIGYTVTRTERVLRAPADKLYVGAAGTPARFLLSFASLAEGHTVVAGNARLSERPMADLLRSFDRIGVQYSCLGEPDRLPIVVHGAKPTSTHWKVSGAISSQFTSSLLLLAAQSDAGPIAITVEHRLVSRPYVDMTVKMLRDCGILVETDGPQTFIVVPGQPWRRKIDVEVDASGMSYFLAAAALTGSRISVAGIGGGSAQGDLGLASVLGEMGCRVSLGDKAIQLEGRPLHGLAVDMETMPDTVLTLASVAAAAQGQTTISNIANLRLKECDRIHAAASELSRLGVPAEQGDDFIVVRPTGEVRPATIHTYDDHRVAMAFSVLGLRYGGISIENPNCVTKSFPGFWDELERFRQHHLAAAAHASLLNGVGA